MNFWTALVIIVAIAAIASMRIARYRAFGDGRRGAPHEPPGRPTAELAREVAELKRRLAVLERIATDDRQSRAIAHEIEQLRDR